MGGYIDNLSYELRRLNVPRRQAGDIVAEVATQISEGKDPVETFGPYKDYAASRAAALPRKPRKRGLNPKGWLQSFSGKRPDDGS